MTKMKKEEMRAGKNQFPQINSLSEKKNPVI